MEGLRFVATHSLLDGFVNATGQLIVFHGRVGALLKSLCRVIAVHCVCKVEKRQLPKVVKVRQSNYLLAMNESSLYGIHTGEYMKYIKAVKVLGGGESNVIH